jgi:hypothetical protein
VSIIDHPSNDGTLYPIIVRIDFAHSEPKSSPHIILKLDHRRLEISNYAIDVLSQNLEEIHTAEEKELHQSRGHSSIPIDVLLDDFHLYLKVLRSYRPMETRSPLMFCHSCFFLVQYSTLIVSTHSYHTDASST